MKSISFILLSLLLALSQVYAQELSSVLEAHYKAAAQEKMQNVQTIISTGKNTYPMAGFESEFKIFQSRPNKLRIEGDYLGSSVVQTFNGETGWKFAPSMGALEPMEIQGQELETLLSQVQFENPLYNYRDKGASLEMMVLGGDASYHLLLTLADGSQQHFFIDRQSFLITSQNTNLLMGGSQTQIEVLLDDYRIVKGIPFAHHIVTKMNGAVVTILQIEKVEVNRKIDPSLFERPE